MIDSEILKPKKAEIKDDDPEVSLELEERMRVLANLIIDRVLEDQKNGKLRFEK